jgi:sulfite oxidase
MSDPQKDPAFRVKRQTPFNGEPPVALLRRSWITPTPLFFSRNNADTFPIADSGSYRLKVSGMVNRTLSLSLDELRSLPLKTLPITLQCAGNRRSELAEYQPISGELPWDAGAISNGEWRGVALADVLAKSGIQQGAEHVEFISFDQVQKDGKVFGFGASIPLNKALAPETLLALEMNGEPLPVVHGAPLRLVAPGYIGARSVKWMASIVVRSDDSENYFNDYAYQLFPPDINASNVDWTTGLKLGELSVNSAITSPAPGDRLEGPVRVEGWAFAGGDRSVARVDVSIDGGATWKAARLEGESTPWTWRFWSLDLDLPKGDHEILCRAWDTAANTQPQNVRDVWNFKGYMSNAWHRVRVTRA